MKGFFILMIGMIFCFSSVVTADKPKVNTPKAATQQSFKNLAKGVQKNYKVLCEDGKGSGLQTLGESREAAKADVLNAEKAVESQQAVVDDLNKRVEQAQKEYDEAQKVVKKKEIARDNCKENKDCGTAVPELGEAQNAADKKKSALEDLTGKRSDAESELENRQLDLRDKKTALTKAEQEISTFKGDKTNKAAIEAAMKQLDMKGSVESLQPEQLASMCNEAKDIIGQAATQAQDYGATNAFLDALKGAIAVAGTGLALGAAAAANNGFDGGSNTLGTLTPQAAKPTTSSDIGKLFDRDESDSTGTSAASNKGATLTNADAEKGGSKSINVVTPVTSASIKTTIGIPDFSGVNLATAARSGCGRVWTGGSVNQLENDVVGIVKKVEKEKLEDEGIPSDPPDMRGITVRKTTAVSVPKRDTRFE